MDYWSGEECGDWCVHQLVRAVRNNGLIVSSVVEHAIQLHDHSFQTVANRLDFDAGLLHSTVV